jgi:hypothetical protein
MPTFLEIRAAMLKRAREPLTVGEFLRALDAVVGEIATDRKAIEAAQDGQRALTHRLEAHAGRLEKLERT